MFEVHADHLAVLKAAIFKRCFLQLHVAEVAIGERAFLESYSAEICFRKVAGVECAAIEFFGWNFLRREINFGK